MLRSFWVYSTDLVVRRAQWLLLLLQDHFSFLPGSTVDTESQGGDQVRFPARRGSLLLPHSLLLTPGCFVQLGASHLDSGASFCAMEADWSPPTGNPTK